MSKSYPEQAKELVRQMRAQSKERRIETQTRASVDPISVPGSGAMEAVRRWTLTAVNVRKGFIESEPLIPSPAPALGAQPCNNS
jgi:hypothetical protein